MSGNTTPFIPPMSMGASPRPPSRGPPSLPTQNPGEALPPWATTPQHAAQYPHWNHTPYSAPPHMTPGPGPTMYIPGNYQPTAPPVIPPAPPGGARGGHTPYILPNGLSSDYTGYPDAPVYGGGGHTPAPASAPVIPPPSAPVIPPPPAAQPPQPSPWNPYQPPLPGAGGYYAGPTSAPPVYGWPPQPPPMAPGGYAPFGQPYGQPYGQPPHSAGMYGAPPYGTPWPAPPAAFPPPTAGMPPGAWPTGPPPHPAHLPPQQPPMSHIPILTPAEGDRVPKFSPGSHYGPVLDPTLLRFVRATLTLNPLIQPVPESGPDVDRPHLKWNMLFPTSHCQRSTDPSHVSWSKGRDEPATWPRVSKINLISKTFPWLFEIKASNPDLGVTCGDVIEKISHEMYKISPQADYQGLDPAGQRTVGESYRFNRSRAHGVPGGMLREGMRRLDFLGKDSVFGGIVDDPAYVKHVIGAVTPATFVLRCVRQYQLTAEEVQEHEERQRRIDEAAAAGAAGSAGSVRSRSRAPSRASRAPTDHGLT